jgi:hypothetical protein
MPDCVNDDMPAGRTQVHDRPQQPAFRRDRTRKGGVIHNIKTDNGWLTLPVKRA